MAHVVATGLQIIVCLAAAHCFVRGLWLNLLDFGKWSSRRMRIGPDDPEF
jgi:hypothetical protein